jgi:hypothetical protein
MRKHTLWVELVGTLGVTLANPNVRCVVIDRTAEAPIYVMAFSLGWNEIRARLEDGQDLTSALLVGGPIEAETG